jgi:PAS domain S-box-containing protein
MYYTEELIPRILRDVDDGVIALDKQGCITYMNPQAQALLDLTSLEIGKTYAEVFFNDKNTNKNDAFHQFVVDAVYDKEHKHSGSVTFIKKNGKKIHLRITSSFLKSADANESNGVVLVLSDITETETLKKKRFDASIVFACVTACVCLYLLLLASLQFLKINVPTKALTQVINVMVFIIGCIIYKKTDFSVEELCLKVKKPKQTFGLAIIISVAVVGLLALAKLLISNISPTFFDENAPFWNWNLGLYSWISYAFTCIIQEFLARSMIYGSIKKMFDGKRGILTSILLSSLLFGGVHIAHGFLYMSAAILLLGSLGGVYEKHRSIWGVTIIHYVLGQAACCLGFLS